MSIKRAIQLVIGWSLSVFYTCYVCVLICKRFLTSPRKYMYCKKRTVRPGCLDDPVFKHKYIRLKDLRMHYVQCGDDSKPLMLLLHGFPECWYSWRHQLREFRKDYRVVAVDNRGYNETEEPSGIDQYTMDKMREDNRQLIDALGYKTCVLVGHDWGGALAWDFASNYPEYVMKLIIMCGPNEAMEGYMQRNFKQFLMSWYIFFFQMPYIPEWFMYREDMGAVMNRSFKPMVAKEIMTEEDLEALKFAFRKSLTGPVNYYRAAFQIEPKTKRQRGHRYKMPTLVLWAGKDMALSEELGRQTAARADDCTFHVVAEGGHFLQQECPGIVNKYMREWLSTGTLKI